MTQSSTYALLAAGSYDDIRRLPENRSPIPQGWTELKKYSISGSGASASFDGSGFSAKVYSNTGSTDGEIVISFAGTEFVASVGGALDWVSGNIPLFVGSRSQQALDAAKLYQQVKADLGNNITFTGHSLGGGVGQCHGRLVRPACQGACFDAILRFESGTIDVDEQSIRLAPGMNATAEVKTGRQRVIDFLLNPIRQTAQQSLKER